MRLAAITAWVRLSTLSLVRMAETWALTVASETPRLIGDLLVEQPLAQHHQHADLLRGERGEPAGESVASPSPGVSRSSPGGHQRSPSSTA
jgi:hypothetical protein